MFTGYHVLQLILHCLMENIKQLSTPTGACTVNCFTEEYHSINYLQSSLKLPTPIIALTHITMYYCHNKLHSLRCLTYEVVQISP